MNRTALSWLMICLPKASYLLAQSVEMADVMRSNGKIYVVVVIVVSILAGFFLYLTRIDSRLKKIEKDRNKK